MPPVSDPVLGLQVMDEFTNSGRFPVVAETNVKYRVALVESAVMPTFVALVAVVAVAAFPLMPMFHVPVAFVPEVLGAPTSL